MLPFLRWDEFFVPTYFLVIALAFTVGSVWFYVRLGPRQLSQKLGMELTIVIMISGLVGSRLMHVVYELPGYYLHSPWDILKIWQGGFVFYGGATLAFFCSVLFLKWNDQPLRPWMDAIAPVIALVYALGRIATLLSGSGYGQPTDLPWGISYPPGTEAPSGQPLHPTPLYAALWEFATLTLLLHLERTIDWFQTQQGRLFWMLLLLHGVGRALVEQFRGDERGAMPLGLSVSTWISLLLVTYAASSLRREIRESD